MNSKQVITLSFIAIFVFVSLDKLSGYEVKWAERLNFAGGQKSISFPRDVCMTDDGLFLISDQHAGEVKIYQLEGKDLKLVGTIGGVSASDGRLYYPTYCFYNPDQSKFGVIDFSKKAILLYDRLGRLDFNYDKAIDCPYLADGIQLIGKKLLVSGYAPDEKNNPHDLYTIDLSSNRTTFLLPSYLKYGLKSYAEYEKKYLGISILGLSGWFSVQGDSIFYTWEGDLKLIKVGINSGQWANGFGKQYLPYRKPSTSSKLYESFKSRNTQAVIKEKAKMSFVKHVFTDAEHVYVIYQGPITQKSNFQLQIYTLSGGYLVDVPIPGQVGSPMYFDKDRGFLYSICQEPGRKEYFVSKFVVLNGGKE